MPTAKSQSLSIGLHVLAVAALLFLTTHAIVPPTAPFHLHNVPLIAPRLRLITPLITEKSGGSNRTLLPARHGDPPPTAHRTFIQPPISDPKLPMPISIAFEVPPVPIHGDPPGDPLSTVKFGAFGDKGGKGIGEKGYSGIGDNTDGQPGLVARSRPGHLVSLPQLIFKVEPEFSEEARKAKYSGVVVLQIEVDTNGRARSFRVVQSPGLGLDKKAIDAVMQWRFKPGYQDGKPVVTAATVEVNFRLL
jgi:periplasmic protein TonB